MGVERWLPAQRASVEKELDELFSRVEDLAPAHSFALALDMAIRAHLERFLLMQPADVDLGRDFHVCTDGEVHVHVYISSSAHRGLLLDKRYALPPEMAERLRAEMQAPHA